MSKLDELRKLYDKFELDTTADRELLAKVKNRIATDQEVNELLDIGGTKLDDIKNFENDLVNKIDYHIDALEKMETESNDVAHLSDEKAKVKAYANMKVRYKNHVEKSEDIYDAIIEAYFQVNDFNQYRNRLNNAKENLSFLE